jgi:hypothetical protein
VKKDLFFENLSMFTNNLISVKAAKILWSIILEHILPAHCFTYGLFQKRVFIGASW